MANLMITKQCNLHCEYCFANEFVGNDNKDIMTMVLRPSQPDM